MSFPSLYLLVESKGAMVAKVWDTIRGEGAWNPKFLKPFNDWEMDTVQHLINNKKVSLMEKDRLS